MDEKIKNLMRTLDLTEDEARELLADDEKIDKGEKLFDLPKELEKGSKKARQVRSVDAYGKQRTRERKEDADKRFLTEMLADAVSNHAEHFTVTNAERQIDFVYNGRKFRIVLSAPRS
jgi:hypothetical protein